MQGRRDTGQRPRRAEKAAAEKAAAEEAAADANAAAIALGKICAEVGICKVGDTGPGGGIVFYDAGSQQSWGRYLEVAPIGWSGVSQDPAAKWCENFSTSVPLNEEPGAWGEAVGTGKSNTDLMLAGCTSGAAVVARDYRGGGRSDWFLPSIDELTVLCEFEIFRATSDSRPICPKSYGLSLRSFVWGLSYWSSSRCCEKGSPYRFHALAQGFGNGITSTSLRSDTYFVRPVRAF